MNTIDISEFGIDTILFCAVLRHKKTGLKFATPCYARETLREYLTEIIAIYGTRLELVQWYDASKFAIDYYRTGKMESIGLEQIKKA